MRLLSQVWPINYDRNALHLFATSVGHFKVYAVLVFLIFFLLFTIIVPLWFDCLTNMMIKVLSACAEQKNIYRILIGCKSFRLLVHVQLIHFPMIIVFRVLCWNQIDGLILKVHKTKATKREEVQRVTIFYSIVSWFIHIIYMLPNVIVEMLLVCNIISECNSLPVFILPPEAFSQEIC